MSEADLEKIARRQEWLIIIVGTLIILTIGFTVGFLEPTSSDLHGPWARVSMVVGWIYFAAWSLSFYPQLILNYRRKSVIGLSFDYQIYNIIGFSCYSVFNSMMYWDPTVQNLYMDRHDGKKNQVQTADVFFSLHALAITLVIVTQIVIYEKGGQKVTRLCMGLVSLMILFIVIYAILTAALQKSIFNWLDYVSALADLKLGITIVKYSPQVYLNYKRKSTVGCNIHNFLLDITGGAMSLAQLFLDCELSGDWSAISGDVAKFGLGLVSVIYDVIFIVQHYYLYTDRTDPQLLRALAEQSQDGANVNNTGELDPLLKRRVP